jgi:hypothetical protein
MFLWRKCFHVPTAHTPELDHTARANEANQIVTIQGDGGALEALGGPGAEQLDGLGDGETGGHGDTPFGR